MNNSWYEDNGIIRLSVISDGQSGRGWIDLLNIRGINVSERFKYSLNPEAFDYRVDCSEKFRATKGTVYEIALLRIEQFFPDWRNRTTINIRRKATKILEEGSDIVGNAEIFCLLSEEFSADKWKKTGIKRIFGLTKSLKEIYKDTGDFPAQLFLMGFKHRQIFLDQDNDTLNLITYQKGDVFAFIVSETNLSILEP